MTNPKRKRSDSKSTAPKKLRWNTMGLNKGPGHPPAIRVSNMSKNLKIRFVVFTGNNYSITSNNIADLICFPLGSSYPYRVTDRYRIKKVELWSPPSSTGAPVTLGFQWVGNSQAAADQQAFFSDTSLGQDKPARLTCVPPKNTSHANWQIASPVIVFQMTAVTGTVIDLTLDLTWQDVFSTPTACSTVQATGAANQICCKALDGLSYILPQGWVVA